MSGTFYSLDLLDSGLGWAAALLIGVLFGFFLEQAGFGSSRKLTGVFYLTDMTVMKVMFSAVVTALVGATYFSRFGWLELGDVYLLDTYWGAQIVGGMLFGVGFVVGGWCPGTALVGWASAKWDALVFLGGAVLGTLLFGGVFTSIRPLYEGAHAGTLFLADSLRLATPLLILLFCLGAVVVFSVSTALEVRAGNARLASRRPRGAAAILVLAALGTFLLPASPVAPEGDRQGFASVSAGGGVLPGDLVRAVDNAQDHVDPAALADLMMAGAHGVTVVDIRPAAEYEAFHLRGALNIPLQRLVDEAPARLPRTGAVVLYSNGTTHAAQAWLVLCNLGWQNVRVLTDGILGFWRDCLTPPSLAHPVVDPALARQQAAAYAARRDFFLMAGGQPAGNGYGGPGK